MAATSLSAESNWHLCSRPSLPDFFFFLNLGTGPGNALSLTLLYKSGGTERPDPPRLCKCHEYSSNYGIAGCACRPRSGPSRKQKESAAWPPAGLGRRGQLACVFSPFEARQASSGKDLNQPLLCPPALCCGFANVQKCTGSFLEELRPKSTSQMPVSFALRCQTTGCSTVAGFVPAALKEGL